LNCQDFDAFSDQLKQREPEPWFVLHLLECEECRKSFLLLSLVRKVLEETDEATEETGEPLDEGAHDRMVWLRGYQTMGWDLIH